MRRLALQGGARVRTQHRYHDNGVHEEADGGHPLVVSYKFCSIEIGFGWCNGAMGEPRGLESNGSGSARERR